MRNKDDSAKTLQKLKHLITTELDTSKHKSALRILKGLDPDATPEEDRASDVSFEILSKMLCSTSKKLVVLLLVIVCVVD